MKLFFTPQAERQAAEMDFWWREHRPGSRDLFAQEMAEARALITDAPAAGSRYSTRSGKLYRRVLLPRTKNHVYFEVDEARDMVPVHASLGAPGHKL